MMFIASVRISRQSYHCSKKTRQTTQASVTLLEWVYSQCIKCIPNALRPMITMCKRLLETVARRRGTKPLLKYAREESSINLCQSSPCTPKPHRRLYECSHCIARYQKELLPHQGSNKCQVSGDGEGHSRFPFQASIDDRIIIAQRQPQRFRCTSSTNECTPVVSSPTPSILQSAEWGSAASVSHFSTER